MNVWDDNGTGKKFHLVQIAAFVPARLDII